MAQYWQRGESIDFTNSGAATIHYGDVVSLGTRIGVAGCDIPVGSVGSLHVTGVFIMPKADTEMSVGAAVFWDADASNIAAAGTIPAGWVIEPAAAADTSVKVKIG